MPVLSTGVPIQGASLRSYVPKVGVASSLMASISASDFTDVPGLFLALDPFVTYALDGFIGFNSTLDVPVMKWDAPRGATGDWTPYSDQPGTASLGPDFYGYRFAFGTEVSLYLAATAVPVHGVITTATDAAPLRALFISASGICTVAAGSWIRATRIS